MSKQADSSHQSEPILKSESAIKDERLTPFTDNQLLPERQKILQEVIKDLSSPPQNINPSGPLKGTEVILDDNTSGKHVLRVYISKDQNLEEEKVQALKQPHNNSKNETIEKAKDLNSAERYFMQDINGNIIEHNYPPEQTAK